MEKREKLQMMDKLLREIDDIVNTQTSLLKKIAQVEAENINLGNSMLDKQIPDILSKSDDTLNLATTLQTEFTAARDKFITDNNLEEVLPDAQ